MRGPTEPSSRAGTSLVELSPVRAWFPPGTTYPATRLVCPVYDTLSEQDFQEYGSRRYNAASFVPRPATLSIPEFVATAPLKLRSAIQAGAFVQDAAPAFYVYGIQYSPPTDILESLPPEHRRREYLLLGLVGCLDLARQGADDIALHERTFADRVGERAALTEATGMHFAPILAGYTLPDHSINDLLETTLGLDRRNLSFGGGVEPLVEAELAGSFHRLWRIGDPRIMEDVGRTLAQLRLLVLDGHHRFTAARLRARRGLPSAPLAMLVENRDRALMLMPWHRVVPAGLLRLPDVLTKARSSFPSVVELPAGLSVEGALSELDAMGTRRERGFLVLGPDGGARVVGPRSADGGFDFDLLHEFLEGRFHLDPHAFSFERSTRSALEAIRRPDRRERGGVAFLLPRLSAEAVEERAFRTRRMMAHKSTMFLPKVAEGVVFAPAR